MSNAFYINESEFVQQNYQKSEKTHKLLSNIHFTSYDVLKIIKNLDPNKAHGHDMINIQMIKICNASICKPLELIFRL